MLQPLVTKISLTSTYLKLNSNLPAANELDISDKFLLIGNNIEIADETISDITAFSNIFAQFHEYHFFISQKSPCPQTPRLINSAFIIR